MTHNPKNNKQPEQPDSSPDDITDNKASNDLSSAAQEAIRMLKEAQQSSNTPSSSTPEASPTKETDTGTAVALEDAKQATPSETDIESKKQTTTSSVVGEGTEEGNTTNDLQQDAFKAMKLDAERKREAEEKARSIVEIRTHFNKEMTLRLEPFEEGGDVVKKVSHELIIGRGDNVTDYVPDIDLTPHGAYRLGLSRRHAIIQLEGERLVVKDLNSRNGTFVNGAIVPGGAVQVIRDGDEIRFGNLAMKVIFEA